VSLAIVRYTNHEQKAAIYAAIIGGERTEDIALTCNVSPRQVRRYKKLFELTRYPFSEPRTPQNACILKLWALEVGGG